MVLIGAREKTRPSRRDGVYVVTAAVSPPAVLSMNCVIVFENVAFIDTEPSADTQSST
jgi:hypothetical protein